tara:strand:+ start:79 stop:267 length:189 start_codon:yes stop_codon:yes gene_type:complete
LVTPGSETVCSKEATEAVVEAAEAAEAVEAVEAEAVEAVDGGRPSVHTSTERPVRGAWPGGL